MYAQFDEKKERWSFSWRNVIYDGDYKLIEYPEYGEYELFNLAALNPDFQTTGLSGIGVL